MARKKSPRQRKSSRKGQSSSQPSPVISASDRRDIEGIMQQMVSQISDTAKPADAAQQIMYEAFEAESPKKQIALARKAIRASADCADAYVLLAEYAETLPEALDLYEEGVAAGERSLGEEGFREYEGHFWGFLETRPYMRAREGVVNCLWAAGGREEAIEKCQEMLELNPNDNQGMRYRLASMLLQLERHAELEALLDQYDEDLMAEWNYTRVLLAFRTEGDSQLSRELLAEAAECNPHVAPYLVGTRPLPPETPDYHGFGDEDEAICYASEHLPAWKNTPGATSWLRQQLKVPVRDPQAAESVVRPRRSWSQVKRVLAELPQNEEAAWEIELRHQPISEVIPDQMSQAWALAIVSASDGQVIDIELFPERPSDREAWDHLVDVMRDATDREPYRPIQISVARKTWLKSWKSKLQQIGITCQWSESLVHADHVLEDMASHSRQVAAARSSDPADWPDPITVPQQVGNIWQADIRQLPTWIQVADQMQRPWMVLVSDATEGFILTSDMLEEKPEPNSIWLAVRQAICCPDDGQPRRPGVVQVASEELKQVLAPQLEPIDVRCVLSESLDHITFLIDNLVEKMTGSQRMGALVESPGVSIEQVGSFYVAAAEFYRQAPWRQVPADSVLRITCDRFQSGPWYAVVMGQAGMELGLALYEDEESLQAMLEGASLEDEAARQSSAISVTYGEQFEIATADLDAAEHYGWQMAGPEAYPTVIRINPGLTFRGPLQWELELLEGCLRAIPEFIAQGRDAIDATVAMHNGPLKLAIAWHEFE